MKPAGGGAFPWLILLLPLLLLTGCFEPETGPEKIRYDRDSCEICRMIISDPRFAAEIRGGPKQKLHKFDDLGDAIHWLKTKPWKDAPETKIWVMDMRDGKTWLDARKAWYLPGQISPMDYGYGAVKEKLPGAVDWQTMRKDVIARGLSSRCDSPDRHGAAPHDEPADEADHGPAGKDGNEK